MRRWLRDSRIIKRARRTVRKLRRAYNRRFGPATLRRRLAAAPQKRIVIGSAGRHDFGWIPTDQEVLDLLKPEDWDRFFRPGSLDAMLAEHVWEHLTPEQARTAAGICHRYLKPGGYLRIAVPDGLHPDTTYIQWVKVGGASPGQIANDHKVLYTYGTLRELFEGSGFRVRLYEYFDEAGKFHYYDWDTNGGTIWRSKRFDPRNKGDRLGYTSIILDAVKE